MGGKIRVILAALTVSLAGLGLLSVSVLSLWAKTVPQAVRKTSADASSISVTVVVVTSESKTLLPDAFSLSQNYPNPFNPETAIRYALPHDCLVELSIYNILGQKVKTLIKEYQSAGYKTIHWDGRDDEGKEVGSGVYFYKIKADSYIDVKKMALLK
jgi:hypothetical protein